MQKLMDDLACSLMDDECRLLVNICSKKLVPGIEARHVFEAWPELAPADLQGEYQRRGIQRELQQTNPNATATRDGEHANAQAIPVWRRNCEQFCSDFLGPGEYDPF